MKKLLFFLIICIAGFSNKALATHAPEFVNNTACDIVVTYTPYTTASGCILTSPLPSFTVPAHSTVFQSSYGSTPGGKFDVCWVSCPTICAPSLFFNFPITSCSFFGPVALPSCSPCPPATVTITWSPGFTLTVN